VTGTTLAGYLSVFPDDACTVPLVSNLNFKPGDSVPNLVVVRLCAAALLPGSVTHHGAAGYSLRPSRVRVNKRTRSASARCRSRTRPWCSRFVILAATTQTNSSQPGEQAYTDTERATWPGVSRVQ
jgi:hypothetical protein